MIRLSSKCMVLIWCMHCSDKVDSCAGNAHSTWWRHQMETFSALLAICAGIHRFNSPHKGHWHGALRFSLICAWINGWVNNREAGDLRRYRAHYDVSVVRSDKTHGNHIDGSVQDCSIYPVRLQWRCYSLALSRRYKIIHYIKYVKG